MPEVVPTRLAVGSILALAVVAVAGSAGIASLRGNRDATPTLLDSIGRPVGFNAPPAAAPDGRRIETVRIAVTLPAGWTALRQGDEELVVAGPNAVVDLRSRRVTDATSNLSLVDDVRAELERRYADARICRPPVPAGLDNGPAGLGFAVCYTVTPQYGRAVAGDALVIVAVLPRADGARDVFQETAIYADADASAAAGELDSVTASIQWKTFSPARAVAR